MSYEIPTDEPERFRAGDTLTWRKSLDEFPAADGWTLHYRLINASARIDITATADGADHLVSVPAATSDDYVSGDYNWVSWVTSGTERHTVATGRITIQPDLAAVSAAGYDSRSAAKKTLDLVDAAMVAYGSQAWSQEYEVAGRRRKFRSMAEFMAFRSQLVAECRSEDARERALNGELPRNKLNVRF